MCIVIKPCYASFRLSGLESDRTVLLRLIAFEKATNAAPCYRTHTTAIHNPKTHVLCNHIAVISKFGSFWRRNALLEEKRPFGHSSTADVGELQSPGVRGRVWGGGARSPPDTSRGARVTEKTRPTQ